MFIVHCKYFFRSSCTRNLAHIAVNARSQSLRRKCTCTRPVWKMGVTTLNIEGVRPKLEDNGPRKKKGDSIVVAIFTHEPLTIDDEDRGARWPSGLERWTGDRIVLSSNTAAATSLRNFGNSVYPALPLSFVGDTKSRRPLLSCVYARVSKISHQSALKMCRPNLLWTPHSSLEKDNSPTHSSVVLAQRWAVWSMYITKN